MHAHQTKGVAPLVQKKKDATIDLYGGQTRRVVASYDVTDALTNNRVICPYIIA
jgi:hypothetical protein